MNKEAMASLFTKLDPRESFVKIAMSIVVGDQNAGNVNDEAIARWGARNSVWARGIREEVHDICDDLAARGEELSKEQFHWLYKALYFSRRLKGLTVRPDTSRNPYLVKVEELLRDIALVVRREQ